MRTNRPKADIYTHEGAKANHINPEMQLRRSLMACMLWEDQFYEDGVSIADRIKQGVFQVGIEKSLDLAIEARTKMNLRHAPLLVLASVAGISGSKPGLSDAVYQVIQRPDELTELLSIYWMNGRQPISSGLKRGLARAFTKFNEYQLAKYNRQDAIKLRDVLFLVHPKAKDQEQQELFNKLVEGKLETPDTWEVALSAGGDKKAEWGRLLSENKLGALALIRNLRNMEKAKVDKSLVKDALKRANVSKVLPFRFIAAAKHAMGYEPELDDLLVRSAQSQDKLTGKTVLVVDVSGSMYGQPVSRRSTMDRAHAACGLAAVLREQCEDIAIYATAGNDWKREHATQQVPARHGMALSDAIHGLCHPLGGGGIFTTQVMDFLRPEHGENTDRVIVITDEQDCDIHTSPLKADPFGSRANYMLNVGSYKNGVGYGKWTNITGFSGAVINYISTLEQAQ